MLLGCDEALKDVKASMSDLAGPAGAVIPASAVALRYAAADLPREAAVVNRFDSLLETPPAEVPVRRKQPASVWVRTLPGEPAPVYGAVAPVWVTVKVPADARPGDYRGTLTIGANQQAFAVPGGAAGLAFPAPGPQAVPHVRRAG